MLIFFYLGDETLYLKSDSDSQLLLQLSLQSTSKVGCIILGVPNDSHCPRTIKLFLDRRNMGFSDANDCIPTQVFVIDSVPTTGEVTLNLQAAKWSRASTITIFIDDNHGADETVLHSLRLLGAAQSKVDVSKIKKC